MICIISNFEQDDEARDLQRRFAGLCECVVVDASGIDKNGFINAGACGCEKTSYELFLASGHEHALFIRAGVIISYRDAQQLLGKISELPKEVGMYTPAVCGQSHQFLKPVGNTERRVPFAEQTIQCCSRRMVKIFTYASVTNKSYLGWRLDIYKGYLCKQHNMISVCDDGIRVYNFSGTAYNELEGKKEMVELMDYLGWDFKKFCNDSGFELGMFRRWLFKVRNEFKRLKKNIPPTPSPCTRPSHKGGVLHHINLTESHFSAF